MKLDEKILPKLNTFSRGRANAQVLARINCNIILKIYNINAKLIITGNWAVFFAKDEAAEECCKYLAELFRGGHWDAREGEYVLKEDFVFIKKYGWFQHAKVRRTEEVS